MLKILSANIFCSGKKPANGGKAPPGSAKFALPPKRAGPVIYPECLLTLRWSGQTESPEETAFAPAAFLLLSLIFFILLRIEDGGDGFIA